MIKTNQLTNEQLRRRLMKLAYNESRETKFNSETSNYTDMEEMSDEEVLIDIEELLRELELYDIDDEVRNGK